VEEKIEVNVSKEEEDLRKGQEAVREVLGLAEEGVLKEVY
jgi:hypothetical protein